MQKYEFQNSEDLTITDMKPDHGLYTIGIYEDRDKKKFLLKKPSIVTFENNEVYQLAIVSEILGKENSVQYYLSEKNNQIIIISRWIENTKDFLKFCEENNESIEKIETHFKKNPPKNFISSILMSIILENLDPSFTNLLIDNNNKFYLIDTLTPSEKNPLGLTLDAYREKIKKLFYDFCESVNNSNLKEKITNLFIEYFKIHNDGFLTQAKQIVKNGNIGGDAEKIFSMHEKALNNKWIEKIIDKIDEKTIIQELSIIQNTKTESLKPIIQHFESKKNFPEYESLGLEVGYGDMIIKKLEKFKTVNLERFVN